MTSFEAIRTPQNDYEAGSGEVAVVNPFANVPSERRDENSPSPLEKRIPNLGKQTADVNLFLATAAHGFGD